MKSFGLQWLPALVHLGSDGTLVGVAEGWDPPSWRGVTDNLAKLMSWKGPDIPGPRDPAPYPGSPALG